MQIDAATWSRDSHELFDYESRSIEKASFSTDSSIRIYRRGVHVFVGPDREGGMQIDRVHEYISIRISNTGRGGTA
jgi:hypothetical protein